MVTDRDAQRIFVVGVVLAVSPLVTAILIAPWICLVIMLTGIALASAGLALMGRSR